MWVLCQKIAEELSKNGITTKEDVYREAIRKASIRPFVVPVKNEAVEHWQDIWSDKGIGWVTENWGAAKTPGYTLIASYPGSSTFDTAEMARLIDFLIDECKQLNIFGKLLQIPLPESVLTSAETLLQAIKDGKEVTV